MTRALLIALLLAGCSAEEASTASADVLAIEDIESATETPSASDTPVASDTPAAADTPAIIDLEAPPVDVEPDDPPCVGDDLIADVQLSTDMDAFRARFEANAGLVRVVFIGEPQ